MNIAPRRFLLLFGAALIQAVRGNSAESALPAAWQSLSIGSYSDASEQFRHAGSSREAELGAAIALVNRPPVTPSSLDQARDKLFGLASGSDEVAHAARYFLGRLVQLHPIAPDPGAAAHEFEILVNSKADDTWCRLALIKLAILRLTVLAAPGEATTRFAQAEQLFARTADPLTQRDLHLVIAEARLNQRAYEAATLAHLRAALAATAPGDALRVDLLIQIGRLATLLGDRETARTSYEQFLKDYPQDRRAFTVHEALVNLDGAFPP